MCFVERMLLLSHHVKISSRVDVQLSSDEDISSSEFSLQKFGYLTLSTNIENGFRARELKTVFLGSNFKYLKLLFHEPHENHYNASNQIGIMNVQLFGYPVRIQAPAKGLRDLELQQRIQN